MTVSEALCSCDRRVPAAPDALVRRLIMAASAAIANERPAMEHQPGTVRGVTVELTLTSAGQLNEAVERRMAAGVLLSRPGKERR